MAIAEKVIQDINKLPETAQKEVVDFVAFLLHKTRIEDNRNDDNAWSSFSLSSALKGMTDDTFPDYTDTDFIRHKGARQILPPHGGDLL